MIQRIQTLWLLLAAVASGLLFKFPVYSGTLSDNTKIDLFLSQNYLMLIVTAVLVIMALVALAMFKNRGNQKLLIWLSVLLNLVFVGLLWMEVDKFTTQHAFTRNAYQLWAALPVVSIVLLIMAYSGIRKDEKLIKSADRLR